MSITITREMIALLKSSLRTIWPLVKSQHADEAVAAYFGFRTYATLIAKLPDAVVVQYPERGPKALYERLEDLGYRPPAEQVDRVIRLFQAEMMGRSSEGFRRMREQTANDNTT